MGSQSVGQLQLAFAGILNIAKTTRRTSIEYVLIADNVLDGSLMCITAEVVAKTTPMDYARKFSVIWDFNQQAASYDS